jgi:hypothetical protein
MVFNPLFMFGLLAVGACLILNARLSYEIFVWVPGGIAKKSGMLLFLWLVPIVGFAVLYRIFDLHWFRSDSNHSAGGGIGEGLVELDMMFNPGAQHLMNAKQAQQTEMQQDGEPDDRDFDAIVLEARKDSDTR